MAQQENRETFIVKVKSEDKVKELVKFISKDCWKQDKDIVLMPQEKYPTLIFVKTTKPISKRISRKKEVLKVFSVKDLQKFKLSR